MTHMQGLKQRHRHRSTTTTNTADTTTAGTGGNDAGESRPASLDGIKKLGLGGLGLGLG